MAATGEKIRRKGLDLGFADDPIKKATGKQLKRLDTKIQKKGGFIESNLAEAGREAKAAKRVQQESIARQQQQESLKLAEAESEVARRRLLRRTGGRQSLIASR